MGELDILTWLRQKYSNHLTEHVGPSLATVMTQEADKFLTFAQEYLTNNRPHKLFHGFEGNYGIEWSTGDKTLICPAKGARRGDVDTSGVVHVTKSNNTQGDLGETYSISLNQPERAKKTGKQENTSYQVIGGPKDLTVSRGAIDLTKESYPTLGF